MEDMEEIASVEPIGDTPHPDSWEPFLGSPAGILLALVIALAVVAALGLLF